MLRIKVPVKHEDKFGLLVQLIFKRLENFSKITPLYKEDDTFIYFIVEVHHSKYINYILNTFREPADIIGCEYSYCFVYNMEEAYSGIDTISKKEIEEIKPLNL